MKVNNVVFKEDVVLFDILGMAVKRSDLEVFINTLQEGMKGAYEKEVNSIINTTTFKKIPKPVKDFTFTDEQKEWINKYDYCSISMFEDRIEYLEDNCPWHPQIAAMTPEVIEANYHLHAFCDGGIHKRKEGGNIGGIGTFICSNDGKEIQSKSITEIGEDVTNNRMELRAIIEALKSSDYFEDGFTDTSLIVHSDSAYCINGINDHIESWMKRNWMTLEKKPVKNKDLWVELYDLIEFAKDQYENFEILFCKTKGHIGFDHQEISDKLATDAVKKGKK